MWNLDRAVARIVNYSQSPDWYTPWAPPAVRQSSGSGFLVEGGLVMTNAHVVSDARMLLVYLHGDPDGHRAVVHAVGHDCDLALLRLLEPEALAGRAPLQLGGLPRLRSTVETFGYPTGGAQISSTRGVVSRIELQYYSHPGNEQHLAVQTDAAINPGNSGGPVVQDGRVVGVAFQAALELQSVGYFIPSEVVHHFLVDAASGRYRGFPGLGLRVHNLANPAARAALGMAPEESGVVVDLVYGASSAEGLLREGDVLLEVDGVRIANDGSVALPPHPTLPSDPGGADDGLRMDLLALVDRHQIGEPIPLRILRDGARVALDLPAAWWPPSERYGRRHDRVPTWFVYGGLVFVPLDLEMLNTWGPEWRAKADKIVLHQYLQRPYAEPDQWRRDRVVLLRRLDHPVNAAMTWHQNLVVEQVNGLRIDGLADLVAALTGTSDPSGRASPVLDDPSGRPAAVLENGVFHVIELSGDRLVILDREEAERANPEILEQYGLPGDRELGPPGGTR